MLGFGQFAFCILAPVVGGAYFFASRSRLRVHWRDALMDSDCALFPAFQQRDIHQSRKVVPLVDLGKADDEACTACTANRGGRPLTAGDENPGWQLVDVLAPEDVPWLMEEFASIASTLGVPHDARIVAGVEADARTLTLPPEAAAGLATRDRLTIVSLVQRARDALLRHREVVQVSDHALDVQMMRAPWNSGDSMREELVPVVVRWISRRVQERCPGVGRLRHVYVEYFPSGMTFHAPTCPDGYDGHEYLIVPLREGCPTGPAVITMSPYQRSRVGTTATSALYSWTNRDMDVLVPPGCALRVNRRARYFWSWSVRPGGWFGSPLNPITLPDTKIVSAAPSAASWWKRVLCIGNSSTTTANASTSTTPGDNPTARGATPVSQRDALLVLHYEGPKAQGKGRNTLLEPESLVFGPAPEPKSFEQWSRNVDSLSIEEDFWSEFAALGLLRACLQKLRSAGD